MIQSIVGVLSLWFICYAAWAIGSLAVCACGYGYALAEQFGRKLFSHS